MKVKCNKVDKRCSLCIHSIPHNPEEVSDGTDNLHPCTEQGECQFIDPEEVRIVKCK